MWLIINFELPNLSAKEKQRTVAFKKSLKSYGFIKKQNSLYIKNFPSKEELDKGIYFIENIIPQKGYIFAIYITDKQYKESKNIYGLQIVDIVDNKQLPLFNDKGE